MTLQFFMTGSGCQMRMFSCLQTVQQEKVWALEFTLQVRGHVPKWPDDWHTSGYTADITVLELFPIMIALFI